MGPTRRSFTDDQERRVGTEQAGTQWRPIVVELPAGPWDGLKNFEEACCAHAAPDAHGDDHVPGVTATPFQESVPDKAGTGHPVRVADGDGPAVDVDLVRVDLQEILAVEGLRREGLIQLPQVDVVDTETVLGEKFRDGEDRSDAHLVGCATSHGDPAVGP